MSHEVGDSGFISNIERVASAIREVGFEDGIVDVRNSDFGRRCCEGFRHATPDAACAGGNEHPLHGNLPLFRSIEYAVMVSPA